MIERGLRATLRERLAFYPGVVLVGPRQVGKTTLARAIAAEHRGALVLDLEREADRARLADPELFLSRHRDKLVVIDEVQHVPNLFAHLRPEIDAARRPGRFVLLGSASGRLLRQGTESLAGRVGYLELSPLLASELKRRAVEVRRLWLRGGFPPAYLAPSNELSYAWRQDFIRTFLERDLPQLGVRTPASTLHRFWRMLAHLHGQNLNASALGASLGGVAHTTVARYLDDLVDTMMVRRLEPHLANVGKRLVKAPKIYLRDSGLLHALLGVTSLDDLQGHPIAGASWEGMVVEQIAAHLPVGASLGHYRTASGNELDVVVTLGRRTTAFEIKLSSAPTLSKGFHVACDDLNLARAYVVAHVDQRYPLNERTEVISIHEIPAVLEAELGSGVAPRPQ